MGRLATLVLLKLLYVYYTNLVYLCLCIIHNLMQICYDLKHIRIAQEKV